MPYKQEADYEAWRERRNARLRDERATLVKPQKAVKTPRNAEQDKAFAEWYWSSMGTKS